MHKEVRLTAWIAQAFGGKATRYTTGRKAKDGAKTYTTHTGEPPIEVWEAHLKGEAILGLYAEAFTHAVSLDIDGAVSVQRVTEVCRTLRRLGIRELYATESFSRGFRIWIFTDGEVRSAKFLEGIRGWVERVLGTPTEVLPSGAKGSNLPWYGGRPLQRFGETEGAVSVEEFAPIRVPIGELDKVGKALWLLSVAMGRLPANGHHKHDVAMAFCNLARRMGVGEIFVAAWGTELSDTAGWRLLQTRERASLDAWRKELQDFLNSKADNHKEWGVPKVRDAGYNLPNELLDGIVGRGLPDPYPIFHRRQKPSFPLDATGPLRPYIEALTEASGAPVELAYAAVLGFASYITQLEYNVATPSGAGPTALYMLTLAQSGSRKTSVLAPFMDLALTVSADLRKEAKLILQRLQELAHGGEKGKGKAKQIERTAYWTAQTILQNDPTLEGLTRKLETDFPILWVASGEVASFFGGYSWGREKADKAAADLSQLWDGHGITSARADKERDRFAPFRRVCLTLMGTEDAFSPIWRLPTLRAQGIWGRFLFQYLRPEEIRLKDTHRRIVEHPLIAEFLEVARRKLLSAASQHLKTPPEDWSGRDLTLLTFSLPANELSYALRKELLAQLPDTKETPARAFANKATQHAGRIAAVLFTARRLFGREPLPDQIDTQSMRDAVRLTKYHFAHLLRFEGYGLATEAQAKAKALWEKIAVSNFAKSEKPVPLSLLRASYPGFFRTQAEAAEVLWELIDNHYLLPTGRESKAKTPPKGVQRPLPYNSFYINPKALAIELEPPTGPTPEPAPEPTPTGTDTDRGYPAEWDAVGPTEPLCAVEGNGKGTPKDQTLFPMPSTAKDAPNPKAASREPAIRVTQKALKEAWDGSYTLLTPESLTDGLLAQAMAERAIGLDTETAGGLEGELRTLQLYLPESKAAYILDVKAFPEGLERLRDLFQANKGPFLCAWNWAFDYRVLSKAGLAPHSRRVWDGMLAEQTLAEAAYPLSLGHVVEGFGEAKQTFQASDWDGELTEGQLSYAASDAVAAYLVFTEWGRLAGSDTGLQWTLRLDSSATLAVSEMQEVGMPLDIDGAKALLARTQTELVEAEAKLNQMVGKPINWRSAGQVLAALRAQGIKVDSTSKEALAKFATEPLPKALLAFRDIEERRKRIEQLVEAYTDGWVKAKWSVLGAPTGRMACRNPNLQATPRDAEIRRLFRAPEGYVVLKADYSQIELRLAALIAPDRIMLQAFEEGKDLHRLTAARVLNKPESEVTKEERQLAKGLNFGLIYGMGPETLRRVLETDYRVSVSLEEATRYREGFFRLYKGIARWHAANTGREVTAVRTMLGRIRHTDKLTEKLNTPVQGSGAEGIKGALVLLHRDPRWRELGAKVVAAIHDEIVAVAPKGMAKEALSVLTEAMREGMERVVREYAKRSHISVPNGFIQVEGGIYLDWGVTEA